jgi:hypothetical protein
MIPSTAKGERQPRHGAAVTFLEDLGRRGHVALLAKVSGRIRFDLVAGRDIDSWLLTIVDGAVTVSHDAGSADCTIRGERSLFDELASGRANMMSAVLRGALACAGDLDLVLAIQRTFPGPTGERSRTGDAESPR